MQRAREGAQTKTREAVKIVIFGLSITSSWGNGHATLWRGLCRGLIDRGHDILFFERDIPYYAAHRDMMELRGGTISIYESWERAAELAARHLSEADVFITTSYCWDAVAATNAAAGKAQLLVFYDLDAPVTIARWRQREEIPYLGDHLLRDYDLVLSYTAGHSLEDLQKDLGAKRVAPLFGSVDPREHRPETAREQYRSALSYLGTYAEDRQQILNLLFLEAARSRPEERFVIGGAQYPEHFPWSPNIHFVRHLAPDEHSAFFSSSRLTLNVTREAMAASGFCPSGRLFEAAACGCPIISDCWEGLDHFFTPGLEILLARNTGDVLAAMDLTDAELKALAKAARERTLEEHTAARRAAELEALLESAMTAPQLV